VLATARAANRPCRNPIALRNNGSLVKNTHLDRDELLGNCRRPAIAAKPRCRDGASSACGARWSIFFRGTRLRPLRTEWEDEELISLREFDVDAQRSVQPLKTAELSLAGPVFGGQPPMNRPCAITCRKGLCHGELAEKPSEGRRKAQHPRSPGARTFFAHDFLHAPRGDFILQENRRDLFLDHLRDWLAEGWEVAIFCNNEGEHKRLEEILRRGAGCRSKAITFLDPAPPARLRLAGGKLVVLSDAEIFGRYQTLRALRQQERLVSLRSQHQALDFTEIADGDYVVHLHHGIALYKGVTTLPGASPTDERPGPRRCSCSSSPSRANSTSRSSNRISSRNMSAWAGGIRRSIPWAARAGSGPRISAQKAVMDYAAQLLGVQAERDSLPGHAYPARHAWQREFEEAFVYEETEDQERSILETKRDMESKRPMDRLICGDVGFGKTEVAIRAVFKAVQDGKQAAFLVPTTILAEQHWKNLRERYAAYPVRVDCLSRLQSAQGTARDDRRLADGSVDVVIGTHRLLSKDVRFKDLGLVIVDEEQRFGVKQKEKFKQLFRLVDVLTLSATPIPRTLYLSLTGARDMSTIETAPPNRHPVETIVAPYDERVIREAIEREMARNGQVYFLHNRIHSIQEVAQAAQAARAPARIDVGHGQMDADELEDVMARFVAGETDVLLSTTIIESGLDIPNANTIIIDRADRFGLADLYQLRGRVGRAQHKAYAYLFLPRHLMTVGDAKKRVSAIKQYSQLGAGFKIAMRDLEIRGAGNLLGTAQSGHITAVGFDLYCQLLKTAVARMKGEKPGRLVETKLQLDFLVWQENEVGRKGRQIRGVSAPRLPARKPLADGRVPANRRGQPARRTWKNCGSNGATGTAPGRTGRAAAAGHQIKIAAAEARIGVVETQEEKADAAAGPGLHHGKRQVSPLDRPRANF
jgi:transcription-repair coupling factor (superfamily II helicase)